MQRVTETYRPSICRKKYRNYIYVVPVFFYVFYNAVITDSLFLYPFLK